MAKKSKQEEAPPTTYELLSGLVVGGSPANDRAIVDAGCVYLDCMQHAVGGVAAFVEHMNRSHAGDTRHLHAPKLLSVLDAYAAAGNDAVDDETRVFIVTGYIDHIDEKAAAGELPDEFVEWLCATLVFEPPDDFEVAAAATPAATTPAKAAEKPQEAAAAAPATKKPKKGDKTLPGQQELPLEAAPEAAPAPDAVAAHNAKVKKGAKDAGGLKDLAGKRVKYRAADKWVVGRVEEGRGAGQTISFVDDDGERWSRVDRDRVQVIKEKAAAEEPAAVAEPDVRIPIKAKLVAKWDKLTSAEGAFVEGKATSAVLASYTADIDDRLRAHVEVTNGDDEGESPYVDVFVTAPPPEGKTKRAVVGIHEPRQALAGMYKIPVAGVPKLIEVYAE